jgi:hypothetical protein
LGLRLLRAFAEEIGIATKVLHQRERDCVNPLLDSDEAGRRKLGDPMGE